MKASVLLTALAAIAISVAGCAHRAEKAAVVETSPPPIATYTAPSAPAPVAVAPAPAETTIAQAPAKTMGAAPAEPAPKADRN